MDNASFGMFGELDNYNDRVEFEEWLSDVDDMVEECDDFAADYYGEEEFG